jgi:hypothetical protein
MHFIKTSFELISEPLKHVVNMSLETGIYPDQLKVAKIISFSRLAKQIYSQIIDQFPSYRAPQKL